MEHKAGFVSIIGNPNVGKSTLMNAVVGEKLSIITSKAQTTRHRIRGIVNEDDFQIVYSDTPGILEPVYKMHEGMMKFVSSALADADILLFVTDIYENGLEDEKLKKKLNDLDVPILLVLNKIDLGEEERVKERIELWKGIFPKAEILPVSALLKFNIEKVFEEIKNLLPVGPPFFPKDELTDKPIRFFVAEMIREKIFKHYKKEIPYSCEVVIESFVKEPHVTKIRALIMVIRDSQKGILIGHQGNKLKRVGTEARKDIEAFIGDKVFLETYVKVDKDWRSDESRLKAYGYLE
ncbi:MAG: GTPase Era [Flavobacteriales bacterium]|nr:GTPase Era [Flavobacteriales bacterium]